MTLIYGWYQGISLLTDFHIPSSEKSRAPFRMSCERAGTRFNVRGVNDDGAVANFVETEQVVAQNMLEGNHGRCMLTDCCGSWAMSFFILRHSSRFDSNLLVSATFSSKFNPLLSLIKKQQRFRIVSFVTCRLVPRLSSSNFASYFCLFGSSFSPWPWTFSCLLGGNPSHQHRTQWSTEFSSLFRVSEIRCSWSTHPWLNFGFRRHFKHLYRHYGRITVLNLIEKRNQEKEVGEEYEKLFNLLVRTYKDVQKNQKPILGPLNERDFIWFEYHDQARMVRNLTPEQFVQDMLVKNDRYAIRDKLQAQNVFTYLGDTSASVQKGVFRINCIDCLDRTNNVQLTIGLNVLLMQLDSLQKRVNSSHLQEQLKEMWINNGDHISRIYTGTGALNQRNIVSYYSGSLHELSKRIILFS